MKKLIILITAVLISLTAFADNTKYTFNLNNITPFTGVTTPYSRGIPQYGTVAPNKVTTLYVGPNMIPGDQTVSLQINFGAIGACELFINYPLYQTNLKIYRTGRILCVGNYDPTTMTANIRICTLHNYQACRTVN